MRRDQYATQRSPRGDGKRINYGFTDGASILGDLTPGTAWTARFVTGSVGPNGFTPKTDEVKPLAVVYQ